MFFEDTPTDSLLELRAHFVRLSSTADVTTTQARNLLMALQLVDAELCARCIDVKCIIPEPRPACKHALRSDL